MLIMFDVHSRWRPEREAEESRREGKGREEEEKEEEEQEEEEEEEGRRRQSCRCLLSQPVGGIPSEHRSISLVPCTSCD